MSTATPPVRLLLVDDHTLMRRGLTSLLAREPWLKVAGEAGDSAEALHRARELQPDLILLDNHLPGVKGVDLIAALREVAPQARILMLTVSESGEDLAAALRAGANGYLLKTMEGDALVYAIGQAMRGEAVISPEMTGKLVSAFYSTHNPQPEPDDPLKALSPRERDILGDIAQGKSNKEIARHLNIAETTVKIHVQHILRKLNLSSRVQAAVFATRHGMGGES